MIVELLSIGALGVLAGLAWSVHRADAECHDPDMREDGDRA